MTEQFIRFTEKDADGCGTDITTIAKVSGKDDIKVETIDRVKAAINNYKREADEWDTDGCLEAAQTQFEAEGYKVDWVNNSENIEICF